MDLHPVTFAYDYMRRTDQVAHEHLKERDPHFISAWEALQKGSVQAVEDISLASAIP